jgi:hypothetical protein
LPFFEKPLSEVLNHITPEQLAGVAIRSCHDLRVGAVAAVAAVGTDELAMEAVHLRATDLAVLTRRSQYLGGLRLMCALFVHTPEYKATSRL